MGIELGAEFHTFEDLTNAIQTYEAENFVNLIIRDTRKVEAAAKRNQRKQYNPAIKYSDISYCCTYGGKKYVCHSTGKRSHKTIKQACPFSLKIRATVDGQRLFVREMCAGHNHQLTEADFRLHPKQRKLDIGSQEEIANLLSMEPDKKLLRDKLMQITGKVILMKDIHNIKTRLVNPRIKQTDCKREYSGKMEEEEGDVWTNDTKIETAEMETQTVNDGPEEDSLPISQVLPVVDPAQNSILYHQPDQQLDNDVKSNCYVESHQTFQAPPLDVYTVNIQAFEPADVYSVNSQPFQQSPSEVIIDTITHDVHQVDPSTRNTLPFQQWTPLENVGEHTVQESGYHTVNVYPFPCQNGNTYSTKQPPNSQPHSVHISGTQPIHPARLENSPTSHPYTQHNDARPQLGNKKTKQTTARHKKRSNSDQKDKELIIKKYFQQATVNLFFNERINSPGSKFLTVLRPGSCSVKMASEGQTENTFHDFLKPLSWLFGKWHAADGKGIFPTISDFKYGEDVTFEPVPLKPVVQYRMDSWRPDNNLAMHRESGYIRIKPNTKQIAIIAAHANGVAEVQEGEVNGQELTVESKHIGRSSFNPPPIVKLIRRSFKRTGNQLEHVVFMQTDRTELTEHLRIMYKKVE